MKLASAFKWISRIFGKLLCLLGLRQSCVYGWIAAVKKEEREKKEKKRRKIRRRIRERRKE